MPPLDPQLLKLRELLQPAVCPVCGSDYLPPHPCALCAEKKLRAEMAEARTRMLGQIATAPPRPKRQRTSDPAATAFQIGALSVIAFLLCYSIGVTFAFIVLWNGGFR